MARNNSSPIQQFRGTTAQHSAYAGPIGELTVDTDKKTVVVQTGANGGVPLAQEKRQVIAGAGITVNGGASGTLASDLTVAVDTEWLTENVPAGEQGPQGDPGPAGADGAAATIAVGSVTTGEAGTQASVTNAGTSSAAVLNFTIPRGAKGDKGDTGDAGPQGEQGPVGPAGEYTAGTGITISGDTLSVNTTWLTSQIDNRIAADHQAFLPLYFTADSLELHSFVPAGVTTVKYSAIEADGSGTSGLTLKMGRDIGSTASMNVTGTAADCSSYAGHSVTFTLSGLGNQTEIAVMIEFN